MDTKWSTKLGLRPIMRKLQPMAKPSHVKPAQDARSRSAGVAARSNLHTTIALLLIALLLAVNFILRFPDLGGIIAQYNQF